jgi:hypothetical protein
MYLYIRLYYFISNTFLIKTLKFILKYICNRIAMQNVLKPKVLTGSQTLVEYASVLNHHWKMKICSN